MHSNELYFEYSGFSFNNSRKFCCPWIQQVLQVSFHCFPSQTVTLKGSFHSKHIHLCSATRMWCSWSVNLRQAYYSPPQTSDAEFAKIHPLKTTSSQLTIHCHPTRSIRTVWGKCQDQHFHPLLHFTELSKLNRKMLRQTLFLSSLLCNSHCPLLTGSYSFFDPHTRRSCIWDHSYQLERQKKGNSQTYQIQ